MLDDVVWLPAHIDGIATTGRLGAGCRRPGARSSRAPTRQQEGSADERRIVSHRVPGVPPTCRSAPTARVEPLLADDPWWLRLIKALMIFVILLLLTLFAIWFERRSSAGCSTGPARTGTARSVCCSRWPTR